jgi:hypothetical protein
MNDYAVCYDSRCLKILFIGMDEVIISKDSLFYTILSFLFTMASFIL